MTAKRPGSHEGALAETIWVGSGSVEPVSVSVWATEDSEDLGRGARGERGENVRL